MLQKTDLAKAKVSTISFVEKELSEKKDLNYKQTDLHCGSIDERSRADLEHQHFFVLILVRDPGWNPVESRNIYLVYSRVGWRTKYNPNLCLYSSSIMQFQVLQVWWGFIWSTEQEPSKYDK